MRCYIVNNCGALRDLVPFVQFKKREKHPWRSVNFSKVHQNHTTMTPQSYCLNETLNKII